MWVGRVPSRRRVPGPRPAPPHRPPNCRSLYTLSGASKLECGSLAFDRPGTQLVTLGTLPEFELQVGPPLCTCPRPRAARGHPIRMHGGGGRGHEWGHLREWTPDTVNRVPPKCGMAPLGVAVPYRSASSATAAASAATRVANICNHPQRGIQRQGCLYDRTGQPVRTAPKGHQPPTANRQPPTTSHQPPTANRQPPTTSHQPPTANRQPPTTSHQPPTANRQPPTANHCSTLFLWSCVLPMS